MREMMNRIYKFRAWNKLAHKMAIVDMLDFMLDSYRAHAGKFSGSGHLADIELMQYIGLKDKNGKEIYEGDIVECIDGYNVTVSYDEWKAEFIPFGSDEMAEWGSGVEVIGNIYENPELLDTSQTL